MSSCVLERDADHRPNELFGGQLYRSSAEGGLCHLALARFGRKLKGLESGGRGASKTTGDSRHPGRGAYPPPTPLHRKTRICHGGGGKGQQDRGMLVRRIGVSFPEVIQK